MRQPSEPAATDPLGRRAAAAVTMILAMLGAAAANAQQCPSVGSRPFVCEADLYAGPAGDRLYALDGRWGVQLELGKTWDLELEARDQFGRRFPAERLALGVEPEDRCRGVVEVTDVEDTRFSVRAGSTVGDCRIWLWVPGNLNLEWSLDVRVVTRSGDDYTRAEAEFLATGLYRALLARDPDPGGLQGMTVEIQRGNLANTLRGMIASTEYRTRIAGKQSPALLEQIYVGLLGRTPTTAAVRSFLGALERGQVDTVVWEIIKSQEFEQRMLSAVGGGR